MNFFPDPYSIRKLNIWSYILNFGLKSTGSYTFEQLEEEVRWVVAGSVAVGYRRVSVGLAQS